MNRFLILLSLLFVLFCNEMEARKYTRQSDSLELVKFYQQTGGTNWTKNDGWRDGSLPVWKWFGIITDDVFEGGDTMAVVTEIDLVNNNLVGLIPELNLPDLYSLFVNNNKLKGLIPSFKNGTFAWMDVSKNKFVIEDFLPNLDFFLGLLSFIYDDQDTTYKLMVTYNANSIFFEHPYKCDNCNYTWFINDKIATNKIKDTMSHNLFFAKYRAELFHPLLPYLKYNSNEFQIITEPISPLDNAKDIEKPVLQWKEVDVANKYYIYSNFIRSGSSTERYDSTFSTTFSYPEELDLSNLTIMWSVAPVRGSEVGTFTKSRSFTTNFLNEYTEPADSLELVRFYNNSNGASWTKNTNWLTDKPVWQWHGVTTKSIRIGDRYVNRVVKLDLSYNKVVLYEIDLDLPYLEVLNLANNKSIVKFNKDKINLPNLKKIDLTENEFQDEVSILNNFKKLEDIAIVSTKVKTINGLKLDSLKNLYVYKNEIADNNIVIETPNLINFNLSENKISGSISLPYLPLIKYLSMSKNEITDLGKIELPSVESFDLSANKITNFSQLSTLSNFKLLKRLILNNNQIEDEVVNLKSSSVDSLVIYNNKVFGKVNLQNLPNLKYLLAYRNEYKDTLFLMNAPNLDLLDLSQNKFSHVNDLNNFTKLRRLFLNNNEIASFIKCQLPALEILSIGNNNIRGEVPNYVIDNPNLQGGALIISGNYLSFEDIRTNYLENKKALTFSYADQKITYKYKAERVGTEYYLEPIYNGVGDKFEWIAKNKIVGEGREFVVDKPLESYQCKISYSKIPNLSYYTDSFNPLPLKLYPTKDAENVEMQPTFRWNKLDYATKYLVTITQDADYYIPRQYYETTDTILKLPGLLSPNSKYNWTLTIKVNDLSSSTIYDPWNFTTLNKEIYLNKKDSLALVDLYNKTMGKYWLDQKNWLTDKPANTWGGLGFEIAERSDTIEYFVTSINLYKNNLIGEIDRIELDSLKILSLVKNNLYGTIPEFSSEVIEQIHLSENKFEDGIENTFKNSAIDIYLENNLISQELPEVWGDKLQYLMLKNNRIKGGFPELNAPNLIYLYLDSNEIVSLPEEIIHDKLGTLTINFNKIIGTLPNIFCKSMTKLSLNYNQLNGEIPKFDLQNLNTLELNNNKLIGEIPSMKTPKLSYFDVSHNNLSGNIPNKFSTMNNTFNISYNKFTFEKISPIYNDYFSIKFIYYPQDTLFELIPFKEGDNYYLEVKTVNHIQKLYTWFKNDTIIDGAKDKRVTISDLDAVYHCRVGYKTLDKLFINTVKSSYKALTSVEDEALSGDVVISPNPAGEYITINIGGINQFHINPTLKGGIEEDVLVEIYDVMGMKIQSTPVETKNLSSLQQRIDISNLAPGVYFVKIGGFVEKFVKM